MDKEYEKDVSEMEAIELVQTFDSWKRLLETVYKIFMVTLCWEGVFTIFNWSMQNLDTIKKFNVYELRSILIIIYTILFIFCSVFKMKIGTIELLFLPVITFVFSITLIKHQWLFHIIGILTFFNFLLWFIREMHESMTSKYYEFYITANREFYTAQYIGVATSGITKMKTDENKEGKNDE